MTGPPVLTRERLAELLGRFPEVRVAVVGDFFLDRYLVTDPALAEQSLETGLTARQVVAVRSSPGHAGTVTNNLRSLGVRALYAVGLSGDDGEGYELRQGLNAGGVDTTHLVQSAQIVTGTYVKPTERQAGGGERELERLDIRNRRPMPAALEEAVIRNLEALAGRRVVDAVIVADQVDERNLGTVTDRVREAVCALAAARPDMVWYADSRRRIGEYRHLALKPNRSECRRAVYGRDDGDVRDAARQLAERAGKTVFATLSEAGMLVAEPGGTVTAVPARPVAAPIDPTGAGDSATAGIVPALALGATAVEAATIGALVASITVRQLGTTGTATPQQVLAVFEADTTLSC